MKPPSSVGKELGEVLKEQRGGTLVRMAPGKGSQKIQDDGERGNDSGFWTFFRKPIDRALSFVEQYSLSLSNQDAEP